MAHCVEKTYKNQTIIISEYALVRIRVSAQAARIMAIDAGCRRVIDKLRQQRGLLALFRSKRITLIRSSIEEAARLVRTLSSAQRLLRVRKTP